MRLNETGNEFQNIKSSTAANKLRYTYRRIASLEHQFDVNNINFFPFEDRFVRFQYSPISDEELKRGYISFHSIDLRGRPSFAIYHSLSYQDIAILTEVFKKKVIISRMITKLEKSLTTLRRNVKKRSFI